MADMVILLEAPAVPGLRFRHFAGAGDFPLLHAVLQASQAADQWENGETVEQFAHRYSTLKHCDLAEDVLIAEVDGQAVGFNRVEWWPEEDGCRIYWHIGFVRPEWRERGLGRAMLHHAERRLTAIAAAHPAEVPKLFDSSAKNTQPQLEELLRDEGYAAVRYKYVMVCPTLEAIPDVPLPPGLEVRPAQPEHYRAIWEASVEATRDHWGMETVDESDYVRWQDSPEFQPELFAVAWDGDQVAGTILNFIDADENARYGRRRGYTEYISVRRPWRRRGLARALLAHSLRTHRTHGMTEATLSVDTENPHGALRLYESMGFRVVQSETSYRKPLLGTTPAAATSPISG